MKNTINLLTISATPLSLWEKAYAWTLLIGRYVIIATELIVLLAFFYKFKLDNELANVKSDIDANIQVFKSSSQDDKDIRTYQSKIINQEFIYSHQKKLSAIIKHTTGLIPVNVNVSDITFNNSSITINCSLPGTSATQLTIIQNIANVFKADPLYENVALNNVQTNSATNLINFDLSMSV